MSERMLAVATRLFADRGFKAVSTREIAHRSGVTLSSLYHHFGDKRSLYVQAHMREFSKSSARLEAAIALGANERQRLLSFTIELLRVLSEPGPLLKLVARHWLDGDPAVVRYLAQATVPKQFGEVRAIIGKLVPQLNATAATLSLYSLAHGLVTLRQFEDSLPWQSGISREPHAMAVFVLGRMVPEVDWPAELARLDEPRAGLRAAGRVRRSARGAAA
ncbi:MAG: helix-turn-helix domain-containing protein [Steroidobacteraceae bacterium]